MIATSPTAFEKRATMGRFNKTRARWLHHRAEARSAKAMLLKCILDFERLHSTPIKHPVLPRTFVRLWRHISKPDDEKELVKEHVRVFVVGDQLCLQAGAAGEVKSFNFRDWEDAHDWACDLRDETSSTPIPMRHRLFY
jgi:chaperone required for assembly of F1-ATPase